jgi:hypothetical protein
MNRLPLGKPTNMTFGSDGIAISHGSFDEVARIKGEQMRKLEPRCLLQSRRVRADVGARYPR